MQQPVRRLNISGGRGFQLASQPVTCLPRPCSAAASKSTQEHQKSDVVSNTHKFSGNLLDPPPPQYKGVNFNSSSPCTLGLHLYTQRATWQVSEVNEAYLILDPAKWKVCFVAVDWILHEHGWQGVKEVVGSHLGENSSHPYRLWPSVEHQARHLVSSWFYW